MEEYNASEVRRKEVIDISPQRWYTSYMKNLSDSELLTPEARAEMKAQEESCRAVMEARKNGTLEVTGDVDDYLADYHLSTSSKHDIDLS